MILRDKILKILSDKFVGSYGQGSCADKILALIDGQRCQWEKDGDGDWDTECGCCYDGEHWYEPFNSFCPCCGKRISISEVKDGQ